MAKARLSVYSVEVGMLGTRKTFACLLAVCLTLLAVTSAFGINPRLSMLAMAARSRRGWPALRRYARSARRSEDRGLAYLVLGYREYQANDFSLAITDLRLAAQTHCSLTEVADYYEAATDESLERAEEGIDLLTEFAARYPDSVLHFRTAILRAELDVEAKRPELAIAALAHDPQAPRNTWALNVLARAYEAAGDDLRAAKTYQRIYYKFPLSPEAQDAARALYDLRLRMRSSFPKTPDSLRTQRVALLFADGQTERALRDFEHLLWTKPDSQDAGEWKLGRARCLLRLGHYDAAAEALLRPIGGGTSGDAERLALLVHVYERAGDSISMLDTLDELYQGHPTSPYYAQALLYSGHYFAWRGFWQTAGKYYRLIALDFPRSPLASNAAWWTAWYSVLAGNDGVAASALESFIRDYPRSARLAVALYWLGYMKEQQGLASQAVELYESVARHFPGSYYGMKARERLAELAAAHGALDDPTHSSDDSALVPGVALASFFLPRPAPLVLPDPSDLVNPAATLAALGMRQLSEIVLAGAKRGEGAEPGLFFACARVWAGQGDAADALFTAEHIVPDLEAYTFNEVPREVWDLLYPDSYWSTVLIYSRLDHVSPYLVMGLIRQESAFDPRAESSVGARGLMQMTLEAAGGRIRSRWQRHELARLLYNPRYNIRVSTRFLHTLFTMFGNPEEAVAAYNAGDYRVRQWLENGKFPTLDEFVESIPFEATRVYVEAVLRDAAIYHKMLGQVAN